MSGRFDSFPYFFYTILLFLFVASLFLVPYMESSPGMADGGKLLFQFYRPMCHQMPSRSLFVFGAQMPVCARDFGIYFGMLAGALLFPFVFGVKSRKLLPVWILVGAMIPIGLDGGIQLLSEFVSLPLIVTYESTNFVRVVTGLFIGVVMSFFAIPLLNDLWVGLMKKGS